MKQISDKSSYYIIEFIKTWIPVNISATSILVQSLLHVDLFGVLNKFSY